MLSLWGYFCFLDQAEKFFIKLFCFNLEICFFFLLNVVGICSGDIHYQSASVVGRIFYSVKFYKLLLFIFCISKHMNTLFLQQTFKNMKLEVYSHVTFITECTTTRCQKVLYFYIWKK